MAAFLCALVSRIALALEGAFCVNAEAVSTQPDILTLIYVCLRERKKATCVNLQNTTSLMTKDSSLHIQHQTAIKSLKCILSNLG